MFLTEPSICPTARKQQRTGFHSWGSGERWMSLSTWQRHLKICNPVPPRVTGTEAQSQIPGFLSHSCYRKSAELLKISLSMSTQMRLNLINSCFQIHLLKGLQVWAGSCTIETYINLERQRESSAGRCPGLGVQTLGSSSGHAGNYLMGLSPVQVHSTKWRTGWGCSLVVEECFTQSMCEALGSFPGIKK